MSAPQPIIRLQVEGMKHTMLIALSQYVVQLDESLQKSVETFCTPENLHHIIEDETHRVLNLVIREEVKRWFTYGDGRKAIKEAVEKKLNDGTTWTPLDYDTEEEDFSNI